MVPSPLRRLLGIYLLVAVLLLSSARGLAPHASLSAQAPTATRVVSAPSYSADQRPALSPSAKSVGARDPFFGIVQAIHDPEKAVAAGVSWERVVVWWSAFQPNSPDDWVEGAWPPRDQVEAQRARGIETVGVVLHTPPWAAREGGDPAVSPPHNLELPFDHPQNYWGQFMARLAREYAGAIDTWIIWNEPEFCWTGTVAEFAQLQRVAYLAVKAANPSATVILTGTTYWMDHDSGRALFLERLLGQLAREADFEKPAEGAAAADDGTAPSPGTLGEGGGEGAQPAPSPGTLGEGGGEGLFPTPPWYFFDAVAVHQYGNPLNSYTVPVLYRRVLASYGIDAPIWLPESNIVPHDDPIKTLHRGGLRATMEEQANYMIQSTALARAAGVARYSIYKMRDEAPENDQYYGLVRNDGTPRPAYTAYQVAIREMSGVSDAQYFWSGSATPPTEDEVTALLASTASRAQFVWPGAMNGVRMRRGDDRVTVLWNATAAPLAIGVPSSVPGATLIDKYGQSQPLQRAEDDAFHLTLAPATNNTDARDPALVLVGGDPVILVEPGAARPHSAAAEDPYPRPIDACWGVPGALVTSGHPSGNDSLPVGDGSSGSDEGREDGKLPTPAPVGASPTAGSGYPPPAQPSSPPAAPGLAQPKPAMSGTSTDHNYLQIVVSPAGEEGANRFAAEEIWVGLTGYAVSGPWLDAFKASGGVDVLGYPRSPVVADPLDGVRCVQYFQRAVLEWHPENPPEYRIQRRLLGAMAGEAAPATSPSGPDGADYRYFPLGEQGLGHAVSNLAPDGTSIGFKDYFDRHGGEATFGYPMESPVQRTGSDGVTRWTQRFQAALFEHHAQFDIDGLQPESGLPWRTWRVQLRLLGDEYLRSEGLPFVSGDPTKHIPRPPEPTPS